MASRLWAALRGDDFASSGHGSQAEVLRDYIPNCDKSGGGTPVDCSKAIRVFIDMVAHELKNVDDHREELFGK